MSADGAAPEVAPAAPAAPVDWRALVNEPLREGQSRAESLRDHPSPEKTNYYAVAADFVRYYPATEHEGILSAFAAAGLQKERVKALRAAFAAEVKAKEKAATDALREAAKAAREAAHAAAVTTAEEAADASPIASDERYLYSTAAPTGVYTRDDNGEWSPKPTSVEAFANLNKVEGTDEDGNKFTFIPKWVGRMLQARAYDREAYVYDSAASLVIRAGVPCRNLYRRPTIEPVAGDWSLYDRLFDNLSNRDAAAKEYLLDWVAKPLQSIRQGKPYRMGTVPTFYGVEGAGKDLLADALRTLYGPWNTVIFDQDRLDARFNGQLIGKLLVIANEATSNTTDAVKMGNKLKAWITNEDTVLEDKGARAQEYTNHFNILFMGNFDRPVYLDPGGAARRWSFFPLDNPLDRALGKAIADDRKGSQAQLEAFYAMLLSRQVKIGYGDLFENAARQQQLLDSEHAVTQFLREVMRNGWESVAQYWVKGARMDEKRHAVEPSFSGDARGKTFVSSRVIAEVYLDWCRVNQVPPKPIRKQLSKSIAILKMDSRPGDFRPNGNEKVSGWFDFGKASRHLALVTDSTIIPTTGGTDATNVQGIHVRDWDISAGSEWSCPTPEFLKWAQTADAGDFVNPEWLGTDDAAALREEAEIFAWECGDAI